MHCSGPEDALGGALAVESHRYLRRQRVPGPSVDVFGEGAFRVELEANRRTEGPVGSQTTKTFFIERVAEPSARRGGGGNAQ